MRSRSKSKPPTLRRAAALAAFASIALVGSRLFRTPEASSSGHPASTASAPVARTPHAASAAGPAATPTVSTANERSGTATRFDSALATLRAKLGPSATPDEIMTALRALARTDAPLAIDLAHTLGATTEEKSQWVSDLAVEWAGRAPQPAWEWLTQLEPARIRDLATGTLPEVIIGTTARTQPELLLRNIDALVHAGETSRGVAPVVAVHLGLEALATHGALELARRTVEGWAHDPRRPAIGEAAYLTVSNALAKTSPEQAGAWLSTLPASQARDIALVEFPAQWAQREPQVALAWAENNLPADLRSAALQRTFSDWVEAQPAEAGEWLGGYLSRAPAAAAADRLIGSLVNLGAVVKTSPATALQWTRLIADPALRSAHEERVALRWSRQDQSAATRHVLSSTTIHVDRKPWLLQQIANASALDSEP